MRTITVEDANNYYNFDNSIIFETKFGNYKNKY